MENRVEEAPVQQISIKAFKLMETAVHSWICIIESDFCPHNMIATSIKLFMVIVSTCRDDS